MQRLRELLGEATLAAYAEMPEVASDVALLRYLRGRDHDVDDAARVFFSLADVGFSDQRTCIMFIVGARVPLGGKS